MRAVSKAWRRTVTGSHTPRYRATLCTVYQTTNQPVGIDLPIIDGTVTLDGAADVRASLDLTVPGSFWPAQGSAALAPQGNEIYAEVGIRYSDASEEWMGLGYFRINTIEQEDATGGPIRVAGQDRMSAIIRAKLVAPRQFFATDTVGTLVNSLVLDVFPNAVITWDDTTNTVQLGRDILVDSDRFAALANIAQAYGKLMYWNASGALTFVSVPNPSVPVDQLVAGRGGVLGPTPRQISDSNVFNAVVARGDATDQAGAAYGIAVDSDPGSPTNYFGPFGPSPLFVNSSLLTTDAQAQSAAAAELRLHSGVPYTISLTISPRPEFEPFDALDIDHVGLSSRERHVLSSVAIPLRAGQAMQLDTRQQSVVLIGGNA